MIGKKLVLNLVDLEFEFLEEDALLSSSAGSRLKVATMKHMRREGLVWETSIVTPQIIP